MKRRTHRVDFQENQRNTIKTLLANLVGDKSRIAEMGDFALQPAMLPDEMKFENMLLRVLYRIADEQNVKPDIDTISKRLEMDFPDSRGKLEALMLFRTTPPDVIGVAFSLSDWIAAQRIGIGLRGITEMFISGKYYTAEAIEKAMLELNSMMPNADITITSEEEADTQWILHQRARRKKQQAGAPVGPTFPWKKLRELVPALEKGEICLWTAKSKHGKSTVAAKCAKYMAHTQKYRVLLMHAETKIMSLKDRDMADMLNVQPGVLKAAELIDIDAEPFATKIKEYMTRYDQKQTDGGEIVYIHCPAITPQAMKAQIQMQKALADAAGQELVVILDYFQCLDVSSFGDEKNAYNKAADYLKSEIAEALNIYMMVFCQIDNNVSYAEKKTPFGGQKIYMRSQVIIRIERTDAEADLPIKNGEVHLKDGIGNLMFYHRAGQPSAQTSFKVIGGNDVPSGECKVLMLNGYFRILEA